ncbi:MAG: LacI family transcriptional regulator [Chloroflexi bacterium]|nr:LacI family transcriptional regulator [Chloroflexota bacterium]
MSTIKDIAQKAGVSIGTVSNFFNNPDLLNTQTYDRIQETIIELNYHPHSAARALKSHQTNKIGIIPRISAEDNKRQNSSDHVFFDFLSAVNTAAAERGYGILMDAAMEERDELSKYKQMIGEKQIDGFVLLGTSQDDPRVELLLKNKFPFVTFGRTGSQTRHAWVDVDGAKGISEAVQYLATNGHQKIGFITPPTDLFCSVVRKESFLKAMQDQDLPVDPRFIIEGDFTEAAGIQAMQQLLSQETRPSAVLMPNDVSAFGAMKSMQLHKLLPGKDISIIGFDNIPLADYWHPSLTTIAQPTRSIGYMVGNVLIDILSGNERLPQILIKPELIIRESTAAI